MLHEIIYILFAVFFFQHLIRDHLQDEGVKDWYTTFLHPKFIPDTRLNNHIGMVIFFLLGCLFTYLAFRT